MEAQPHAAPGAHSQNPFAYDAAANVGSILPENVPSAATPAAPAASASSPASDSPSGTGSQSQETAKQEVVSSGAGASAPNSNAAVTARTSTSTITSQVLGSPTTAQLTAILTAANGPPGGQGNSVPLVEVTNFTQGADGVLTIYIGGASGPGAEPDGWTQINASGLAQLDGTLRIELTNGFSPAAGQKFKVLTWGSRSGTFANWLGTTGIPGHPDYYFKPIYNEHDLTLEVVEDPDIVASAKTAILNGLNTLSQVGTLLNNVGSFAQNIPFIGDKLSSFIDSGSAINNVLKQQLQNLFGLGPTAEAAVTTTIQSWDSTTFAGFQIKVNSVVGNYDVGGTGPFWWDVNLDLTPAAINKTLANIASAVFGATLPSPPTVSVQGKLSLVMSFGYDGGFFIKVDHLTASANVSVSGLSGFPVNFAAPVGSLSVTNGSVILAASITATPDASILTANGTTGPRIEMATLTNIASSSNSTSDAFNYAKSSSLNANLTLNSVLGGFGFSFTGTSQVQVQSSDLFSGADPAVTVVTNGALKLMGQSLTGVFTFKKTATETDLVASGVTLNLTVGPGSGQRVLQATGSGEFLLEGSGLAGTATLTLAAGSPAIPGLSNVSGTFNLAFNTTGDAITTIDGAAVNLPAGPYYRVSGHGTLALSTPSATLTADFDFEPVPNSNPANGNDEIDIGLANLTFNFDNGSSTLLSLTNGSGAFVITPTGIYGTATVTANLAVPGVSLSGTFSVLLNNTGSSVSGKTVNVDGTSVVIPALASGQYLRVSATGAAPGDHAQLTVLGVTLAGDFSLENQVVSSARVITVTASNVSFNLGTVSSNLLSITNGSGNFVINTDGLAGQGTVTLGVSIPGVSLSGSFTVSINQTTSTLNGQPPGPYLQVKGTGVTLSVLGASMTGNFSFEQQTSTTGTQLITVSADNVSFNFGTSLITATGGTGFFIINDAGIMGAGSITVGVNAFGGLSHTFSWSFNNTDPAIDQNVLVDGLLHSLNLPDGPFNRLSSGGVIPITITVGGQPQSISAAVVLTLLTPANSPTGDYLVTVGVSNLSMTLGGSGVTLAVNNGTGALVINSAGVAGVVTVASATLSGSSFVTLNATNLKLEFNNTGADVGPLSVSIDDNSADNVAVQFAGAYYHNYLAVSGAASLVLGGTVNVTLGANFAFETPGPGQFKVSATELHLDLKAGTATIASFNHGSGAFVLNSSGLAGVADLQFQAGVIGMSGTIKLKLNTTASPVNTTVTTALGTTVINLTDVTSIPNDPIPANYLRVNVNGNLHVGSISLPFNFYVIVNGGNVEIWQVPSTKLISIDSNNNITLSGPLALLNNLDFAKADPFQFVSMLKQLGTWIDSFRNSSIFDIQIPFTDNKTIGDAFDWSQLFINDIYSHLVSVELQSTTVQVNQLAFSTGSANFQLQFDSDTPVYVSVPGIGPYGPTQLFSDGDIQTIVGQINTGLANAHVGSAAGPAINLSNRVLARENLAGQLTIALTDSEVSKGTKLSLVAANSQMALLGFGPADTDPTTVEHVAVLTTRYPTENPASATNPDVQKSFFGVVGDLLADWLDNGKLDHSATGTTSYDPARQVFTYTVNLGQSFLLGASDTLSAGDFANLSSLVTTLRAHANPVSAFIWNQFTSSTQAIINNVSATVAQQESALISDLNRLIQGPSIYDPASAPTNFNLVTLSADTNALRLTNPTGSDLAHLNRLLLQDAYPGDFADARYPLSFTAGQDFGSIAGASLTGALNVTATVGLQLTLGFDLSAKEVPRLLSSSQVPVPANGQTSADATFNIIINDGSVPVQLISSGLASSLTLHRNPIGAQPDVGTATNGSIDDLATDLNNLFAYYSWNGTPLNQLLIAQKAGTGLAISAKDSQLGIINRLVETSAANDTFATELGFGIQLNQTGTMMMSASNAAVKGLFVDNAHLTGSLSVTSTAISGTLKLGFVNVTTSGGSFGTYQYDGTTPAPISATIALQNQTTGATRLYISDLMNGTSSNNIGNMVQGPTLTGSFLVRLNNISVSGLGFSLPLNNPQISIWIPDIKNLNYNSSLYDAASNNEGLFVTYPSLGDLQDLSNLNFFSIIQALQAVSSNLSQLSAFSFLNDKLPLIDMSVNDLINYAAKFASIINGAGSSNAQSLQDTLTSLKTQIDQLLHLDPSILQITVDDGGLYGLSATTAGGVNTSADSTATLDPFGPNDAITITSKLANRPTAASLNGSAFRIIADASVSGAQATWDATNKILTVKIHDGSVTANAVITAIGAISAPWTASLAAQESTGSGNNGTGSIIVSSLVTRDGQLNHSGSTATVMPGGDNNDFSITSVAGPNSLDNSIIRIVGDSAVTDTSAQVSWDAHGNVLTIKVNPGKTTAANIVAAINAAEAASSTTMPWTATLAGDSTGTGKDGSGTITTVALKFDLHLSAAYANSLPFQLNLQDLVNALGGTNASIAALLQAATSFVQIGASGNLTVSASADLTLDFGLDITNPLTVRPFFYDTTGVVLTAKVLGTNLNVHVSLGSVLGIFIENGTVTIDGDGDPTTNASSHPADKGAEFRLGLLDNNGDGRHYFDEDWFNSGSIDLHLTGGVSANLPIFAPLQSTALAGTADTNGDGFPDNVLHFEIPDLARFFVNTTAINSVATLRIPGPNNDIQFTATLPNRSNFAVVLVDDSSVGNTASASHVSFANNTLTITIATGVTTAATVESEVTSFGGFTTANAASNDGTGLMTVSKILLITPDFSQLFNNLDFCTILSSATGPLLDGLDTLLGKLQDGLNSIVSNVNLPLIGKGLSGAANFIQDFRNGLLQELRNDVSAAGGNGLTAVQDAIKKAFWNTLGPGGLNLLVDVQTGHALDRALGYSQLNVTLDCNTGLSVKLRLAKTVALVDTTGHPIQFSIGVPGFGLQGNINVNVALGFDLKFGFGVSPSDGFYFDSSAPASDPELKIFFKVSLPNTHFTGQLLFLQLDVADDAATPSFFQGQFSVDLTDPNHDGKLTWAELTSGGTSLSDIVHAELGADASVNLDLAASFGGDTAFPRVLAQFHLRWHFDVANGAGTPQIYFDNIYLDVGSFISNFLQPILAEIQKATSPIQPIIDVVTARIPILSDLAGHDITLLDLAQLFGLLEPSTVDFIKDVAQVITLIDQIKSIGQGDILIPFGSFSLSGDNTGNMSQVTPMNAPTSVNLQNAILNDPDPGVSSTYQQATAGFAGDLGSLHNFSIPVFDHPSELFNLFIGKPVRLVEWRMPEFKFTFTYVQQIPIYPPLYAQFGGSIGATIHIGFGYDTYGIQKFINDPKKQAIDLLDGFYIITNDANGNRQPALTLTGEIFAGASIDLVIVSAGVRGGIDATVNFYWNDNSDNDGKMRVSEIIVNALEDPRCIFNIEGSISLFLEAYLKIDLFFFSIDKTWRFANITLVTFDLTCPEPVLGSMSGSVLTLNMGPDAGLRQVDDTSDGSETFTVRHISGAYGNETVLVTWAQHTQQFTGVSEIDANGGQGNDVIDLRGVLATAHVQGGPGNDTIYLSDGPNSTADGGSGDDTITASSAATATGVTIHGGDGNDTLTAGTQAITIYGDGGNDTITGSPKDDMLYGGDGNDTITGGDGNDFIDGGAGNDVIDGGNGNDFILGGAGDDVINAGPGDDVVDAGAGNDVVYGGAGNDLLIGGNGNDHLYGDGGNDLIIGDKVTTVASLPIVLANLAGLNAALGAMVTTGIGVQGIFGPDDGSSGNDFIVGGGGSDVIFGGNGDDFIYGGNFVANGDTAAIVPDGNDFIDGGTGNDTIFGDDSMGRPGTRNTGIAIKSNVWYDQATGGVPNGLQDSTEKGLGGITVGLYRASAPPHFGGTPITTTVTDVDGTFQFVGLDPLSYVLLFSLPPGMNFTTPLNLTDVAHASNDSDAAKVVDGNHVIGETSPFFVGYDTTFKAVSAGYTGNATVSISDASVKEGNSGQTPIVFNLTLSGPQAAPVQVEFTTADGTATVAKGDYTPVNGTQTVTFNPGETSKQITIMVNGDTTYEPDEQFQVQILRAQRMDPGQYDQVNPVDLLLSQSTATGTILNDDPIPAISISDYNPRTANPLFSPADFVNVSDLVQKLTVHSDAVSSFLWAKFSTADQQILANPGSSPTQQELTLIAELNPILNGPSIYTAVGGAVTLSTQTNLLRLTSPTGDQLVLLNRLVLQDAYTNPITQTSDLAKTVAGATEGDLATFVVTLSNPSSYQVKVDWRTDTSFTPEGLPAPDAAIPAPLLNANFTMAQGTVTFLPGQTTQIITVQTLANNYHEGDTTFFVDLSHSQYASIADSRGYGIIPDKDPAPSVSIAPVSPVVGQPFTTDVTKGNSPIPVQFRVQVSAASGLPVTVTWATSPGTAVEARGSMGPDAGDLPDYVGVPTSTSSAHDGQLVFKPGDPLFQIITVMVNPTNPYPNPTDIRTFFVNLLSANNANIAANPATQSNHATVVIQQAVATSDAGPWSVFFSANNYDVQEPASGTTTINLTVERTPGSSQAIAVFFTTNGTATAGMDYASVFRQLVSFGPTELSKTIPITIYHDGTVDGDETVNLSLFNPTGGPVRGTPGTATITIHDSPSAVWIEAPLLNSTLLSASDFTDFSGLVSKLASHPDAVSAYLWSQFPAIDPGLQAELLAPDAPLQAKLLAALNTILGGASIYDATVFSDVTLSPLTTDWLARAQSSPAPASFTEFNRWLLVDSFPAQIAQPTYGMVEGSSAVPNTFAAHNFVVHLSAPAGPGGVDVAYETMDLTASSVVGPGQDYQAASSVVHIGAGLDSATIPIQVLEDMTPELNDTFIVRLKSTNKGTLDPQTSAALGTIYDDDLTPIKGFVFYDTNGNGFQDLNEKGLQGVKVDITYYQNGVAQPTVTVTTDASGQYTANVLLGQVNISVEEDTVKAIYGLNGSDSSYTCTTRNQTQAIEFEGILGLPAFDKIGYLINSTTSVDKSSTKDAGNIGTDDTIYGGPGNDTIDAGGGDNHVVGGHWMTATDNNMPINQGDNHTAPYNRYDAIIQAATQANTPGLPALYGVGPIFQVDTSGLTPVRSISGQIWLDANNNGTFDGTEQLFTQNVVVTLYDCDGNVVNAQVTNNGSYSFQNIYVQAAVSDYVVQFDLPGGFTFSIPGANNKVVVGGRTHIVNISSATPAPGITGLDAGIISSAIQPVNGGFQFSSPSYSVSEAVAGGVLTVTVQRGNSSTAQAVVLHTEDGTAHQSVNYTQVSALLEFGVGETLKTVAIPIKNVGPAIAFCSDPLTFSLVLRDPTGRPLNQATVYIGGQSYGSIQDNDTIKAGDGWDIILGDSGNIPAPTIIDPTYHNLGGIVDSGGQGNDTIHGGGGPDYILGQLGNDTLYGDSGLDQIFGGMGNDVIYVGQDSETIDGGYGFDTIVSARDVPVIQLRSAPTIPDPTAANLLLKLHLTDSDLFALANYSLSNIEMAQLYGGPLADPSTGQSAGAADNIFDISNWNGSAFIVGNGGNDTLLVQNHIDMKLKDATPVEGLLYQLFYGFYKDGALSLSSGGQYDLSSIENVTITLTGGPGGNTVDASGYSRPVTFKDFDGNDILIGGSGNDTFAFNADLPINPVTITGNGGIDTLDFSASTTGVTANLGTIGSLQTINANLKLNLMDKLENVTGGSGNDSLTGNDLANVLIGGLGSDYLAGGAGNDTYPLNTDSPLGTKTIFEDKSVPGFDTLDFSATMTHSLNVDLSILNVPQTVNANLTLIIQGEGLEQVIGGAQDDVIRGNSNNNVLRGGLGNDLLDGKSGNDILDGGPGNNILIGGPGVDTTSAQGDTNFALTNTLLTFGTQSNSLDGIEVANLTGGPGANVFNLTGWTGTGSINGGGDPAHPVDDTLMVGADANFTLSDTSFVTSISFAPITLTNIGIAVLTDGPGSHTLDASGFSGEATLNGGDGNDTFIAGADNGARDIINGGSGNNALVENLSALTRDTNVAVQNGLLDIVIDPNAVPPSNPTTLHYPLNQFVTFTGIQSVTLTGGSGHNNFDLSRWTTGSLTVNGPGAFDAIFAQAPAGGTVTLTNTSLAISGSSATIALSGIEGATIIGSSGNDTLDASGFSGTGTTYLYGGGGDDVLVAAAGNCTLDGGAGNDTFVFAPSASPRTVTINGGDGLALFFGLTPGEDTLDFSRLTTPVNVNLATLSPTVQPVTANLGLKLLNLDIEDIIGSAGGGTLTGNSLNNIFTLTGGANNLDGGAGTNTVVATANADFTLTNTALTIGANTGSLANIRIVKLTTGPAGHTINAAGFSGSTMLTGGAGNDTLIGGSGNNLFIASPGNDTLTGGAGNDTFMFDADLVLGTDTITGNGGNDTLDFSATSASIRVNLAILDPNIQTVVPGNLKIILEDKIENLVGGSGDDVLIGNILDNVITGGPGNDVITGGGGSDTVLETRDANFVLTNTSLEIYRTPLFSAADITDLNGLVARLQSDGNLATQPVSQYLWSHFTTTARQVLTDVGVSVAQKKLILVGELNRLLQNGALYDPVLFAGVSLHADTLALKNQTPAPAGQDLVRLNRWLLDDIYTGQMAASHEMDTLNGITNATLIGGAGNNTLDASAFTLGTVTLFGMDGNDILIGGYGNDFLYGGNGNDTLYGGAGSDSLYGGAGDDILNGCGKIDTTLGIPDGNDLLVGGLGNDTYVFDITAQAPTASNTHPSTPIPQGTDTISEFGGPGQGYADQILGLGAAGLTVNLSAPTQFFYLNLLTNTIQVSTGVLVGSNYQLLLTLNLPPGEVEHSF
jgi:Ca2+-binding RTX toxin-like protein